jgi:hypothetical protein
MVPRGGIEPTTLSLEGFCSSTELPGQRNPEEFLTVSHKYNTLEMIEKLVEALFISSVFVDFLKYFFWMRG